MGKEEKKINRRDYLKYTGAGIGGLIVGGALGYLLKPKEVVEKTITAPGVTATTTVEKTIEKTIEKTVAITATPTKPPVELTVFSLWGATEEERFLKTLEAFTAETGIKVKHVKQPEEMRMLVPMEFAAGRSTADVIMTPWIAWVKDLAKEGHLIEVTDLLKKDELIPIYVKLGTVDGKCYAAPFKAWAKPGFWYRISFFKEHGLTIPTTWDEFIKLLDTLKGIPGIEAPIASGDTDGWPLTDVTEAFLIYRGGPELQEKLIAGEVTFTDPQVKAIMKELADLLAKGYFSEPADWTSQIDKLWMGKYGIYFMGNWMTIMPQVKDVKDLGFFPFPGTKGAVGGGDWAIIPKYSQHLEEAKMLVKFLAGPKAQEIQVRYGGFLPTNLKVPEEAFTPADKKVVDFLATVKVVPDLDDAVGGSFLREFRSQLKLLWVKPDALESVLEILTKAHLESTKKA